MKKAPAAGAHCRHAPFDSVLGKGFVAALDGKVFAVEFRVSERKFLAHLRKRYGLESRRDPKALGPVVRQLREYFSGKRKRFDVAVEPLGGSAFERRVWKRLAGIPWGRTMSYGELAAKAGSPKAARAVGGAMARNPVPVILPCHRVVRADGSPGGYGLGSPAKKKLLELEKALT